MRASVIALLLVSLLGCANPPIAPITSPSQEVAAATEAWRSAFDSRDPALITAMYAPDAVFWGTTMKTIATSPVAVADYFKDAASRPNARVVFTEQYVRVYGEVAFNSGAYTYKDSRDGKDILNPSRYSMVFHRQSGIWVLVHHHSSRVP